MIDDNCLFIIQKRACSVFEIDGADEFEGTLLFARCLNESFIDDITGAGEDVAIGVGNFSVNLLAEQVGKSFDLWVDVFGAFLRRSGLRRGAACEFHGGFAFAAAEEVADEAAAGEDVVEIEAGAAAEELFDAVKDGLHAFLKVAVALVEPVFDAFGEAVHHVADLRFDVYPEFVDVSDAGEVFLARFDRGDDMLTKFCGKCDDGFSDIVAS